MLVEDTVALLGLLTALIGIVQRRHSAGLNSTAPLRPALASRLQRRPSSSREGKNLPIGEPALPVVQQAIVVAARADESIRNGNGVSTAQLRP